jgi:hypothetical protein
MSKFKVGDVVKCVRETGEDNNLIGMIGKVVNCSNHSNDFEIYHVDFGVHIEQKNNSVNDTTHIFNEDELEFIKDKRGKLPKPVPIDKHVVIQDSCGNFIGFRNSYKEAEDLAKSYSNDITIYKMVEVAKVTSERRVKKVKIPTIKKKR